MIKDWTGAIKDVLAASTASENQVTSSQSAQEDRCPPVDAGSKHLPVSYILAACPSQALCNGRKAIVHAGCQDMGRSPHVGKT